VVAQVVVDLLQVAVVVMEIQPQVQIQAQVAAAVMVIRLVAVTELQDLLL
jgi:hypothetical protein